VADAIAATVPASDRFDLNSGRSLDPVPTSCSFVLVGVSVLLWRCGLREVVLYDEVDVVDIVLMEASDA